MKSRLYLTISAILWGLNFHFAAFMLKESTFIESATWRYIFGVLPLLILSNKILRKIEFNKMPIKGILLVGIIVLFGFNIFFFLGLKYTSPVNAALIISLNPMITIWLSAIILKTQITKFHIIGATLSLFGVIILLTKGDMSNILNLNLNKGDFLILIANIVFALHHVWVKQFKGNFSNLNFTTLTNFVCLLCFLLVLPATSFTVGIAHTTNYWLWAMGIGTFGTAIAYLLWNQGVSQLGADKAGIFMNIVPFSTALSAMFIGEILILFHLISGIMIIGGIFITQFKK
ncbi:MAG: EamA family transporter [Saprospiraceae bacterium]|nr:EamA family transporter [Saprospiraceae bacterium]